MWMSACCWMAPVSTFASTVREPSSASAGPATSCTLMATPVLVSHSLTQFHCCLPAYLKLLIDMHAVGQKKKKNTMNATSLCYFVSLFVCVCVHRHRWMQTSEWWLLSHLQQLTGRTHLPLPSTSTTRHRQPQLHQYVSLYSVEICILISSYIWSKKIQQWTVPFFFFLI